jgi:hypothetical protein
VRRRSYPRSAVASLLLALLLAAVARAVLVRRLRAVQIGPPSAVLAAESDDSTPELELPSDATSPTGALPETVTHDSDDGAPDLLPRPEQLEIAPATVRVDGSTSPAEERETPPIPAAVGDVSAEEPPQCAEAGGVPQRSEAQAQPAGSSSAPVVAGPGAGGQRRTDLAAVRVWARANGYTVADRGRIAAAVLVAYDQAH